MHVPRCERDRMVRGLWYCRPEELRTECVGRQEQDPMLRGPSMRRPGAVYPFVCFLIQEVSKQYK